MPDGNGHGLLSGWGSEMTDDDQIRRNHNQRWRKSINTVRQPRKIMVVDERCADPYFITRSDYDLYWREYAKMQGVKVILP